MSAYVRTNLLKFISSGRRGERETRNEFMHQCTKVRPEQKNATNIRNAVLRSALSIKAERIYRKLC